MRKGLIVGVVLVVGFVALCETYRVGIDANYPPWSWFETGQYRGFEVEIIKAMSEHLGFDVVWVALPWETAVPALKDGKLDILVGGMFITCEREKVIDFTAPYFVERGLILVKKGSDVTLATALGGGLKVGGMAGGTEYEWLEEQAKNGADLIPIPYETNELALLDLEAGRISAMVADVIVAYDYLEQYDVEIAGEIYKGYNYEVAAGVQEGDPKNIVPVFNEGLKWLWESGEWQRLWAEYMNPKLPPLGPLPLLRQTTCE